MLSVFLKNQLVHVDFRSRSLRNDDAALFFVRMDPV